MDEATRKEIQRTAERTLRDAGLTEPPLSVERLLEHVNLYRDYYDLSDPGFLDRAKHKLEIHGRRLVEIVNKVRLRAVLLFDENRICIDNDLPRIKRPWASCHETGHRILPWLRGHGRDVGSGVPSGPGRGSKLRSCAPAFSGGSFRARCPRRSADRRWR